MQTLIPAPVPASHGLDELNAFVAQFEEFFGPLADLDHDNSPATILRFAMSGTSPNPPTVIAPQADGRPVVPDGAELVCQGVVFVRGQLVLAAATRVRGQTGQAHPSST